MHRRSPLRSYTSLKRTGFKKKKRKENLPKKLWKLVSLFIRRRDADENGIVTCISCEKRFPWKYVDAGHFIAASLSLALRYFEVNINGQCKGCNKWDQGSIHKYTIAMRKKYGDDIVEELERMRKDGIGLKLYKCDYLELIEKYEAKLAALDAAQKGSEAA